MVGVTAAGAADKQGVGRGDFIVNINKSEVLLLNGKTEKSNILTMTPRQIKVTFQKKVAIKSEPEDLVFDSSDSEGALLSTSTFSSISTLCMCETVPAPNFKV